MANLDRDTINAIKKISDSITGTGFEINRFVISDSAIENRQIIEFDIRRIVTKDDAVYTEGEKDDTA